MNAVGAIKRLSLAAMLGALITALTPSVGALECEGLPLRDGCLFTVTGADTPDPDDGFAVTNAYDVPVWDFVRGRDRDALGYPISQRWTDGPFTLQAFQKVILQWDPNKQRMNYYNTLDALANRYPEVELPFVPSHQVLAEDQGAGFGTIVRNHLALLDQNETIKARFLAEPDWLNLYGLPIRYEEREVDGNPQGVQMLRTQRTVFVVWNVPAPGITVGRVNLQNVPDKVKRLSNVIIPDHAKAPVDERSPEIVAAKARAEIYSLLWAAYVDSPIEQEAIDRLEAIASLSPEVFSLLMHNRFDISSRSGVIRDLYHLLNQPPTEQTLDSLDLVFRIASLPWVQDGITADEQLPVRILSDSSFLIPAYVEAVLHRDWLHDGINGTEVRFLDQTYGSLYVKVSNPPTREHIGRIMAQLVAMPYMDTIEGYEADVFPNLELAYSLRVSEGSERVTAQGVVVSHLTSNLDALEGVVSYLTSKGGLTDEQTRVIDLMTKFGRLRDSITNLHDPTQIDPYLADPASLGITIEGREISLPLAGPTLLLIVRDVQAHPQTMNTLEHAVRLVEGTMGEPFPTSAVLMLVSEGFYGSAAVPEFTISPFVVSAASTLTLGEEIMVHELGHFYWDAGPKWITEGGATFMEFIHGYRDQEFLPTLVDQCTADGIANITGQENRLEQCNYWLGAALFLNLHNELGSETFFASFRRLYISLALVKSSYLRSVDEETNFWHPFECDYCDGVNPGLYHLRRAFVDENSPEAAAIAEAIILRWYYGGYR